MARSTSVVVRGCTPQLRLRFSKASMQLQFGNLAQRCEWLEGTLLAASEEQDDEESVVPPHMITSLQQFIDLVEDTGICGNYLDGKDLNPCPPLWATPLFDSTNAWNHTMHLRFTPLGKKKDCVEIDEGGPKVIRSPTWSSQGWRLITHPGYVTLPHHDCCGMCTYVVGNAGAKVWATMRPKRGKCPSSLQGLVEAFTIATTLSEQGTFPDADIATVCLEEGDMLFQPPGVLHCVYTPVPSIVSGGYFYHYETMHLTRATLSMIPVDKPGSLTNDDRPGYFRTLCRMLIALRYRSEPRTIGKRSLISIVLIILDQAHRREQQPNPKDTSGLADEERGELIFASKCAKGLLKFMKLTVALAMDFVDSVGPYYACGDEKVEIPALEEDVPDAIFPEMTHY
ncbi:hypothetical protein EV363DRAFT_1160900 [Boletus edulis]|uniref:JmjC domain-containing protein n=1 Tax=Boletus edulis BED1 TaxID=1328754 RepID=A0AAD4BGC2_BOLED|nr:hypothetical protein EV363DRAFT_1160900 [Boletus edulis]KAF8427124.1 hypothetical protein L210DRAFT_936006 [Boletus edulis BED1]